MFPVSSESSLFIELSMPVLTFDHLTQEERLALISELWDSLETDGAPLTDAQSVELDRRLATADGDLADSVPWETIRAEMARSVS